MVSVYKVSLIVWMRHQNSPKQTFCKTNIKEITQRDRRKPHSSMLMKSSSSETVAMVQHRTERIGVD